MFIIFVSVFAVGNSGVGGYEMGLARDSFHKMQEVLKERELSKIAKEESEKERAGKRKKGSTKGNRVTPLS